MITVVRPKSVPTVLLGRGVVENKKNCDLFDGTPLAANRIKLKFSIYSAIYNDPSIKKILRKAQYNKCCFCEKFQIDEYAEVEHYRPKLGYKTKRTDKIKKPGYYWLGYTWENLFFICKPCNVKKGNIFPLFDETKRAKNHGNLITNEKPLILNPIGTGQNDPRKHIQFVNQYVIGTTDEGRATVEACKLDRDGLDISRQAHLDELAERILTIIENMNNLELPAVKRAITYLKNSIKKEAQFSAMSIDYINNESPILIT